MKAFAPRKLHERRKGKLANHDRHTLLVWILPTETHDDAIAISFGM